MTAAHVRDWLTTLHRTAQGLRFYPAGSDVREQLLDVLHRSLTDLLGASRQLHLRIRDGAIDVGTETVVEDADQKSFGNILFSNSILEVVFSEGVTRKELESLLCTVLADYQRAPHDGEELATAMWRLELPHITYKQVDLLTIAILGEQLQPYQLLEVDDDHFRRLKRDIDTITQSLAIDARDGTDLVAAIDGALETPEDRYRACEISQQWFDNIARAARARMDVHAKDAFKLEQRTKNTHEEIVVHLVTLLFDALRRETRPHDPSAALELLLVVFDSIIEEQQFDDAARIVRRLTNFARRAQNACQVEFSHRFLVRFGRAEHIHAAVDAVLGIDQMERTKALAYLDALERYAMPNLLEEIDRVDHHEARTALCELIVRHGDRRIELLVERLPTLRHEAACSILRSAKMMRSQAGSELVWAGLLHAHPQVRAAAVQALSEFGGDAAHRAVVVALEDDSDLVVSTAIRVIQARNILEARIPLARIIDGGRLQETETRLVGLLLGAYARLEGKYAVARLENLARTPGLLSPKRTTTIALAAIKALSTIVDDDATEALARAKKSMIAKVRRAAQEALAEQKIRAEQPTRPRKTTKTPRPALEPQRGRHIELLPIDVAQNPPVLPNEFLTPMPDIADLKLPDRLPLMRLPSDALRPLVPEEPPPKAVIRVVVGDVDEGEEW